MARDGLGSRRWARAVLGGALLVGLLVPAGQAQAAGCPVRETHTYLDSFGDPNQYFILPGGTFESGATPWTLTWLGRTTSGNEPWAVVGGTSARLLSLPAASGATSPTVCVATNEDSLRFFYRSPGIWFSRLDVKIYVKSRRGSQTWNYSLDGAQYGWQLTDRIPLPDLRDSTGKQQLTVTLTSAGLPATWLVDDVLVDPWKTR